MPIDVATVRKREFPVADRYLYLNHAGVSPIPACAAAAGSESLFRARDEGAARPRLWLETVARARERFARLIGAAPEEVAFVKNTSEGISFVAAGFPWKEGDNLVLTDLEFPSNVYPWLRLRSRNVEVRTVAAREGRIRKEDLFEACDGKTRLIALSSVEFGHGFRNDLPGIGEFCQRNGIFFCVDAIQSLGVIPMDVRAYGIDALAADGHKWMLAPEGIGGFFLSRDVLEMIEPLELGWNSVENRFDFETIDFRLAADARRFEPGTHNVAGIGAFDASLDLLLRTGIDRIWERVRALTDAAIELALRAGYEVLSSRHPEERSGIVTFRVPGADPVALWKAMLARKAVCSPRCGGIRVSPHFYNTPEEVGEFFRLLAEERHRIGDAAAAAGAEPA